MRISVVSGRSGTGKTLVATSLAVSLAGQTAVQFLDCAVEEPDAHLFLKPSLGQRETITTPIPGINLEACTYCGRCAEACTRNAIVAFAKHVLLFTELCCACGACSYICPQKAITEEKREVGIVESGEADGLAFVHGRLAVGEVLAPTIIRRVKELAARDGVIIIDTVAGTSRPVVEAIKDSDFAIVVTEPNPAGLAPVARVVATLERLGIPGGFVINGNGDAGELEEYARKQGLPVLLNIPQEDRIARLYSEGVTLAEGIPEWREDFAGLYRKIQEMVG